MEGWGGVAEADTRHLLSAFVRYEGTEHTLNKQRRQAYRGNPVSSLSNGSWARHIGFMSAQLQELRAVLAGRYGVERELGQGGMASVYLARDIRTCGTVNPAWST